ncbi:cytochrome P450 6B2-like [Plodia interpunctella]|uniref:cytochrome P450 6B2-like n=1 Tax=Plodia interpunctella TaxID=58824 RepID=UPI0023677202|nr:cytochrome P450 6B2-like [Plodia interpunctella]
MLLVLSILFASLALYWFGNKNFNYWKGKGIKHDPPLPFVGNNLKQFIQKASVGMTSNDVYNRYPEEKVVGFYRASAPELVIRDPEIAKRILMSDFNSFSARGLNPHRTVVEPLLRNIFLGEGDLWRLLRQNLTPLFSTGKLKAMFPLIVARAERLQTLADEITGHDFYDARELMARYTTEFIGECGFGISMDTLTEENNQFRRLGRRIFERNLRDNIYFAIKFIFPELAKNMKLLAPELEEGLLTLVQTVIQEKKGKPSGRCDFIDLMLEIREKGNIIGESLDKKNPDGTPKIVEIELDDLLVAAQAFIFFGAGFETSSTASSYVLHQLAFNPDWQVKLQDEIDKVLASHNNKLSYEAIKEMKYLEMAFYEGSRMYPSVAYLVRMCTVPEYTFPELNLTINDGVKVFIPVAAYHNDEKYFSNPEVFNPERFRYGIKEDVKKGIYMPFGDGPRSCIGTRLGMMQAMAGLAAVLQKFTVEPAACSKRIPDPDPAGIITEGFLSGLPLKFKKRVKSQS